MCYTHSLGDRTLIAHLDIVRSEPFEPCKDTHTHTHSLSAGSFAEDIESAESRCDSRKPLHSLPPSVRMKGAQGARVALPTVC